MSDSKVEIVMLGGSRLVTKLPPGFIEFLSRKKKEGCLFLVGDCYGADALIQEAILGYDNICIYGALPVPRNKLVATWTYVERVTSGSFKERQTYKDKCMCAACDSGGFIIVGDSPGTYRNIRDLESKDKPYIVF